MTEKWLDRDSTIKATQVRILLDYAQTHNSGVTQDHILRFHEASRNTHGLFQLDVLFAELSALVHPVTIHTCMPRMTMPHNASRPSMERRRPPQLQGRKPKGSSLL